MSAVIAQAYRVGFKAGAEKIVELVAQNVKELQSADVFDESTLTAVEAFVTAIAEVIEDHKELL